MTRLLDSRQSLDRPHLARRRRAGGCGRLAVGVAAAALALSLAAPAQAKLIEVWGSGLAGAMQGNGETRRDFFYFAKGGAAGIEVGVKVLFIGAYIDYLRFFGGEAGANLVSFNLGGDWSIGLSKSWSLVIRAAGSFYLGTLDNAEVEQDGIIESREVQTRGVGARGGLGLRYTFAKVFSVGITPQIGYHYFFAGAEEDITDTDQNSSGWDFSGLAYFRLGLGF